jgi:hypothetical protein
VALIVVHSSVDIVIATTIASAEVGRLPQEEMPTWAHGTLRSLPISPDSGDV